MKRFCGLAIVFFSSIALAQTPVNSMSSSTDTGVKPYTPYIGARENINLTNGNVNINIPLLHLPGRNGLDLDLALQYDSKIWKIESSYEAETDSAGGLWEFEQRWPYVGWVGWRLNLPALVYGAQYYQTGPNTQICYGASIVTLPDGDKHSFTNDLGCPSIPGQFLVVDADDGSGMRFDARNPSDLVVVTKNGTRYHFSGEGVANKIEDSNGNYILIATSANNLEATSITDTVGRVVTLGSGFITYKNHNGADVSIQMSLASFPLDYFFYEPIPTSWHSHPYVIVNNRSGAYPAVNLSAITFPDGRQFRFEYNGFFELSKIYYPTGGYTAYEFPAKNTADAHLELSGSGISLDSDYREIRSKRVCRKANGDCEPSEEDVTTFTPGNIEGNNGFMEVIDPTGHLTRHEFTQGFVPTYASDGNYPPQYPSVPHEVNVYTYAGAVNTTPILQRVHTTYDEDAAWGLPTTITTTFYDRDNQAQTVSSSTTNTYEPFTAIVPPIASVGTYPAPVATTRHLDNVLTKSEVGFDGIAIRRTENLWLTTNNGLDYFDTPIRILSLIRQSTVFQGGSSSPESDTKYTYDQGAPVSSGAIQLNATLTAARGNLTRVSSWRSGEIWEDTTYTYFDTGNVNTVTSPPANGSAAQTSTFTYEDSFNSYCSIAGQSQAYRTSSRNPLNKSATMQYNRCDGTLSSVLDERQKTTAFSYDLNSRVTDILAPATAAGQGHTHYEYSPIDPLTGTTVLPFYVRTVRSQGGGDPDVRTTVTYDGLGRELKSTIDSDPDGPVIVDTAYDGVGQVLTRTNPYRSTGESTYGITQYRYDALGRVEKLILPDGTDSANNVSTTYSVVTNGLETFVTDQDNKQRKRINDALGRLIQVIEPGEGMTGGTPAVPATGSTATLSVSGNEQTRSGPPSYPAAGSTGSVTISGNERTTQVGGQPATSGTGWATISGGVRTRRVCDWIDDEYVCVNMPDTGYVTLSVNGYSKTTYYGQGSTATSLASSLANAFNGDGASPVSASSSSTTVYFAARATGAVTNYSLSWTSSTTSEYFTGTSFSVSQSSTALTGGQDYVAPTIVNDSGTVYVTVNGVAKGASYGSNSTPSTIATDIAYAFNVDGNSPVRASPSGGTLYLASKATGASTNYTLSVSSATNSGYFSGTSFPVSQSGGTMTGGQDAGPATTIYDAGAVTVTVGGFAAVSNYGQGSTADSVASSLRAAFGAGNSPVNAGGSGSSIQITSKTTGASTNYSISYTSASSDPGHFSPSFSGSGVSAMTGGTDGTPAIPPAPNGIFSFNTPYITNYRYDARGNLLCVEQQGNVAGTGCAPVYSEANDATSPWRVRRFQYDGQSHLTRAKNPESNVIAYTYDSAGNVQTKTDARSITTTYTYDELNRVKTKSYSNGDPTVTFSYDQTLNGTGRRTAMVDASGSASWSYDELGRATTETRSIAGVTKTISYVYNLAGAVASITYPSTRVLTYKYNGAGQAYEARDAAHGINYVTGATFTPTGSAAAMSLGGIINVTNAYNDRQQPVVLSAATNATTLMSLSYDFGRTVNDNGNVHTVINNISGARTQVFTYDGLNRLKTAQTSNSSEFGNVFTYDAWGNLNAMAQYAGKPYQPYSSPADLNNRGTSGYCYDAAGNATNYDALNPSPCNTQRFYYDAEGRISNGNGAAYTYDGDGRRVNKSTGTLYFTGTGADPLAETDAVGAIRSEYIFFGGQRVARLDAPTGTPAVYYYISDHLGTTRVIANASGTMCYDADNYPYGADQHVYLNNCPQAYKFTGKERDSETGLDYFGARFYGGNMGRWMSPDWSESAEPIPYSSLDNPQTLDLYGYVRSNAITTADLDGHGWLNLKERWANFKNGLGLRTNAGVKRDADEARRSLRNKGIISPTGDVRFYSAEKLKTMTDKEVLYTQQEFTILESFSEMLDPPTDVQLLAAASIEVHHELPQQFANFFKARGLDIEDYTIEIDIGPHRLRKANGLHARGTAGWNQAWDRWIKQNPGATREQVLQQLEKMKVDFGLK